MSKTDASKYQIYSYSLSQQQTIKHNKQFIRNHHLIVQKYFLSRYKKQYDPHLHTKQFFSRLNYIASTITLPDPPFTSSVSLKDLSNPVSPLSHTKKSFPLPAILTLRYFNSREIAKMAGESSGNRNYSN